ncbi:MAG TPA: shikimate dehydrogenase [Ilumatobacteraceae bacterium]|nr:shikimate dehydrogenase [Ilumatobacteraceae bacterium]
MTDAHGGLIPTGATTLFTIIGRPVVQVVAPRIFNRLFAESGHDAVLVAFDLRPGAVGAFFDAMRQTDNFRGSFVTVPHKQEAARHMDELTTRSSALGVVNAVKRVDGRLVGDMTDGVAFLTASRAQGLDPVGTRVAMIGGGGTATAIAHACAEQGVAELVLSVRNRARRDDLRRIVESVPNPPRLSFELASLEGFDLVINATTVGMNGDPEVPYPVDSLDSNSLVADVVTLPRVTPWIAAALERGCRVQYGADMSTAQLHLVGPWWGLEIPPVD